MAGYHIHSWILDILEGDSSNVLKILIVNFRKLFPQAQGDPVGVPSTHADMWTQNAKVTIISCV